MPYPDWLKPYEPFISDAPDGIELVLSGKHLMHENELDWRTRQAAVNAQVGLLTRLRAAGLLAERPCPQAKTS